MPGNEASDSEHIITVESTQIYRGEVSPEIAEELTNDGVRRNIYGEEFHRTGPDLDLVDEVKRTYECSCGKRFRKGQTAREHLECYRDTANGRLEGDEVGPSGGGD